MSRPRRDVRVRKWRTGAVDRRYAGGAMELDFRICDRARLARDPRFDGRFFIAVLSTGVYCRPICPSPHASRANVRYYRSAAEAVAAGFRPCLRCRPEAAPGTPAWSGTSATVSRALRLIHDGAFTRPSVAELSRRLGVSPRHLDRLFTSHLGASPTAVVRTWRLNAAKELISDTDLPMSVVAQAAGFGSVRRFNDSIRRLYGRTPTALRRTRSASARARDGEYVFRIAYRPPFDWEWMLGRLAAGAIPGVEEAFSGAYRRTFSREGRHGVIEVRHDEEAQALEARIRFAEPRALLPLMSRVREIFDVSTDAPVIAEHLGRDAMLARLLRRRPAPRVPGAWDPFELAVVSILERDAGPSAPELAGRIARQLGESLSLSDAGGLTAVFPGPDALADARLPGVPDAPARAIRSLARAARGGAIAPEDPTATIARLAAAPGVGEDVAATVAMRALRDPDAFPAGDPALRRAAGGGRALDAGELRRRAEPWRPWRAYAAVCLWRTAADEGAPADSAAVLQSAGARA